MNLKGLTGNLSTVIGSLTGLLQDLVDGNKEQIEIQSKISAKLDDINEKLNQKNICKVPSDTEKIPSSSS